MIDSFEAGRYKIGVLYLDNHLLGVEKPCNIPVQKDSSGDIDLLTACRGYIKKKFDKPGEVYLGLVHRLDRPVGGAMVLARTSKAAARLSAQFSVHSAKKTYLAVTADGQEGEIEMEDWLLKDEKTGMVSVVEMSRPGAKKAVLISRAIAQKDGLTLREVELMTGRPHQIRVQHAHRGMPIWGDARYGTGKPGEQIALWAARLSVEHPTQKIPVTLYSRPPQTGARAPISGGAEPRPYEAPHPLKSTWALFEKELEAYYE